MMPTVNEFGPSLDILAASLCATSYPYYAYIKKHQGKYVFEKMNTSTYVLIHSQKLLEYLVVSWKEMTKTNKKPPKTHFHHIPHETFLHATHIHHHVKLSNYQLQLLFYFSLFFILPCCLPFSPFPSAVFNVSVMGWIVGFIKTCCCGSESNFIWRYVAI